MMLKDKKILVTGGAGFLGTHVTAALEKAGVSRRNITVPRSADADLRHRDACDRVVVGHDIVIHLAAKVGGIGFNKEKPGELLYDNLAMGVYMMDAARAAGVKKFVTLGSICAYPKFTRVPFREEDLWYGYPEETNAPYGIAKKSLLVQAQAYRAQYGMNIIFLLPVNLYGPGDEFDPRRSHVIPALIRRFVEAKRADHPFVEVWGTGRATRGFLYVEDAARGIVLAAERYDEPEPVNLGADMEISIRDLATLIARIVDYRGEIRWDASKPDGQPRRRLDVSRAEQAFGFRAGTDFEDGLRRTVEWYLAVSSDP